jgi:membrane protease YdiL (CAAX protease family)
MTVCFLLLSPLLAKLGLPPLFTLLALILVLVIPMLLVHLRSAKRAEFKNTIAAINGFQHKLPLGKLVLYVLLLVLLAFIIWGATAPLSNYIIANYFHWIPASYSFESLEGYSRSIIITTLIMNLLLNGIAAPVAEEFYFRGYLLPRMHAWGKYAFAVNALLFSIYHFWQPEIYVTLMLSLLPMTYAVWKTKDIRVGIYTHSLLNIIGALLSFGLL